MRLQLTYSRRRMLILILIISMLLSIGSLVNVIRINNDDSWRISERNSTEYSATVIRVIPPDEKTGAYGIIQTEEYGNELNLFGMNSIIDMNDFMSLQPGQKIYFRIPDYAVEQFEETNRGTMVSLRTDEKEIVSLDQRNDDAKDSLVAPTIAGIVVSVLLLLLAIHCILILKGVNIFRKR